MTKCKRDLREGKNSFKISIFKMLNLSVTFRRISQGPLGYTYDQDDEVEHAAVDSGRATVAAKPMHHRRNGHSTCPAETPVPPLPSLIKTYQARRSVSSYYKHLVNQYATRKVTAYKSYPKDAVVHPAADRSTLTCCRSRLGLLIALI